MMIIGCDFHPRFQQIAFLDRENGEYGERRLMHPEEAAEFYRSLGWPSSERGCGSDRKLSLVSAITG